MNTARPSRPKLGLAPRTIRLLAPSLLLIIIAGAYSNLKELLLSLHTPTVYHKDFLNNYVLGKAALAGVNPYTSIADLGNQFIGPVIGIVFPHPSPYPPPNVLMFLPFSVFSYFTAVVAWNLTQLICLLVSMFLIARGIEFRRPFVVAPCGVVAAFSWSAVAEDFIWGNSMLVLLFPLTLAWLCLRLERQSLGGICLGLVIALKVIAWPMVLFLLIKRQWRASCVSVLTIALLNLSAGVLIGFDRIIYYYRNIPAMITPLYRGRVDNFSFYAVGWRFFDGTGSPIFDTLKADPLIYAPNIAALVSVLLPLLALCVALYHAGKIRSFDVAFAAVLCACILCGPLAWRAYLTWLIIPLAIAAKLCLRECKHKYLLAIVIILLVGYPTPLSLIANAFVQPEEPTAPFATTFFSLIPVGAVCGLFTLLIKLNADNTKTKTENKSSGKEASR